MMRDGGGTRALGYLRRSFRQILPAAAFAILLIAVVLALWKVPERQLAPWKARLDPKDFIQLENSMRATLAQILGGVALLIGLYYTWRRVTAAEKTVEVSQEGQITERFTRAIEQLGSDKLEVRLGGIYALERIARDSKRDHWPIMEVLTAYVRERAPWKGDQPPSEEEHDAEPTADIQAILTVLGRRKRTHEEEGQQLVLAGVDLRGANLAGAQLEGAILLDAHMERTNLAGASLAYAILDRAHLCGANLAGVALFVASLRGADLTDAVGLTKFRLASARINGDTKLPTDLQ